MKAALASVLTAVAASVCCIGPVVAVTIGAGGLGAAAVQLAPYRPVLVALTIALLGFAFVRAYRPAGRGCAAGATCEPMSQRRAKLLVWVAAALVLLFVTFPYYVEFFI